MAKQAGLPLLDDFLDKSQNPIDISCYLTSTLKPYNNLYFQASCLFLDCWLHYWIDLLYTIYQFTYSQAVIIRKKPKLFNNIIVGFLWINFMLYLTVASIFALLHNTVRWLRASHNHPSYHWPSILPLSMPWGITAS